MFRKFNKQAAALALGLAVTGWSSADATQPNTRQHVASGQVRAATRRAATPPVVTEPAEAEEEFPPQPIVTEAEEAEDAVVPQPIVPESTDAQEVENHAIPAGSPPELIQERFPNGKIHIERYVTLDSDHNFVNHGPFTEHNKSGKTIAAGEFNMGRYQGTWVRSYEPNQVSLFDSVTTAQFRQPFVAEVHLEDGELHGEWTVFDARHLKVCVWNFEHGKRNGKSIWFHANGQPAREVGYHDGLLDGKSRAWNAKGQLIEDDTFIAGRRLAKTTHWHSAGKKSVEGNTLFAKQPIESRYDWWNAHIVITNAPDCGTDEKTGLWTWWYDNGQKQCEGQFNENLPDGHWVVWHSNGQKHMEGDYQAGEQIGRWLTWTQEGKRVKTEALADQAIVSEGEFAPADETEIAPLPVSPDHGKEPEWTAKNGRLRMLKTR